MPTSATIHIQKIAPGPPSVSATATPAMLPVPTRLARLVQSAWKGEMPSVSPVGSFATTTRNISPKCRICWKRSRMVK